MRSLIRYVLYYRRWDISLCGYKEINNYIEQGDENLRTHINLFLNNGSFIELVKLLGFKNYDFKTN